MSDDTLTILLDGPFILRARPDPLPGDLRMAWGLALVLLILESSRGKRASLQKIHFLAHSARTTNSRLTATAVFEGKLRSSELVIRVEPWVNRALAFAKGLGFLTLVNGKSAQLTDEGLNTAKKLLDASVLAEEKDFLTQNRSDATEGKIEKIMKMESLI